MTDNGVVILLALCVLALVFIAGSMSYDDEAMEAEHYKDMVCAGAWPAYNGAVECDEPSIAMPNRY